jgi:alkylation response protein AidB-like acyl-CoA dehydrogenase
MQPWQDPELEEIRNEYIAFAKDHMAGDARERDKTGEFSLERWRKAAEYGALGICFPKQYGGQGRPVTHAVAAFEGLGYGCRDTGFLYAMFSQICGIQMALNLTASEQIKEKYLPLLISGKRLAAYCFTEETSGSDVYSMEMTATEKEDGFVLNGTKRYLTNSPNADLALVFARTGEGRSPFAITAFLVDMDWEGARHGEEFEKVGFRTTPMGEIILDNVFVPKENVVGSKGGGLRILAESVGWERSVLLANTLGPMARSVDECVERAKTREQYGKPIGSFQGVSSRIANMIMRYKLSRQIVYDVASRLGNGESIQPYLEEAAMAKLFVSENYIQLQLDAVQIFGVRGILMEYGVQQDLRDSVSSTIWAGTSETLRNTIAKFAGLQVN